MSDDPLLARLIGESILDVSSAEALLVKAQEQGHSVADQLSQSDILKEDQWLPHLASLMTLDYRPSLHDATVPENFLEAISLDYARNHTLVAVDKRDGVTYVATARPDDFHALDDVASLLDCQVEAVVATSSDIRQLIDQSYQDRAGDASGALDELSQEDLGEGAGGASAEDLLDIANRAPVIRLVNSVFSKALQSRASDIHFQPMPEKMRVRFRVDGVLYDYITVPKESQEAVISRLKVMSRLDIAEKRSTQDGRTALKFSDREIDVRVSVIPTAHGEQIVMRLLDKGGRLYNLKMLGLGDNEHEKLVELIGHSHGIILTTGPTGSGKTTTLYASLSHIDADRKNIITIEDPIEYQLPGISQIQVEPKKKVTFATGLRSVLRQDPDVLMVGEIRDLDTATNAIQSALTGHLVFSTLHTNDSAGAITRMQDLGIEPYLVASSVIGVIAQRLVRRICPDCKTAYEPTDEELVEVGLSRDQLKDGVVYRGEGCDNCMFSGYFDRVGIYEIMMMNEAIERLVLQRAESSAIKRLALEQGMTTLRMDGARKVLAGQTTIEEVLVITQRD